MSVTNMFRACISSGSRAVASTSKPAAHSAFFHSTSFRSAHISTKQKGLRAKKINVARTERRLEELDANQPSVILGTRPGEEETKWKNCDLAKILINEEELFSNTEMRPEDFTLGTVQLPKEMGYGVDEVEKNMLFDELPQATQQMMVHNREVVKNIISAQGVQTSRVAASEPSIAEVYDAEAQKQLHKANMLARVLDLRNANAAGIAFENRRRIILAFSTPDQPFNPGRTEVQVALLTYQIRKLWIHLNAFKRDVGNRRGMSKLVHQRAKLLKYLKNKDRDRYETILQRVALDPESVEGELVV